MSPSRTIVSSAVLTLLLSSTAMAADGWGASWSFGPSTSRIIHAKTTLVPGRFPPMSKVGPLFLWPGMSNSKGDLIQTTMDAYSDNSWCGASSTQWCVEASVFGSFGQRNGPSVAIDPDDHVTIDYKLESDNNTWTQTVTSLKLGKVVSTLQSASGPMPGTGFGFATEADADSFTIDNQYYLCTELHFAEADPHFATTGVGAAGAKYGATGTGSGPGTVKNLRTPDGGLTWLVDLITLPAMNPQGPQTPAPAINCDASGGSTGMGGATGAGGAANGGSGVGGATTTGGKTATGGTGMGGAPSSGGTAASNGGNTATSGGSAAVAGATSSGGSFAMGGAALGGALGVGGNLATGAAPGSGGLQSAGGSTSVSTANSGGKNTFGGAAAQNGADNDNSSCACDVPGQSSSRMPFGLVLGALLASRLRRTRRNR